MHWLDLSVLVLYAGLLMGFGFFRSTQTGKDPESFILAGRKLSLPGFVITLVATWYGGILGIGENTYNYGIQTWFIFGLPYYVFALIFAFFIAGKINRLKTISLPDQFHKRYGKTAGVISALYVLILASPAPYILSIGILVQFTTGMPLDTLYSFPRGSASAIFGWVDSKRWFEPIIYNLDLCLAVLSSFSFFP